MRTRLRRAVECVMAVSIVAWLASCGDPGSQPSLSTTPAASYPSLSTTITPTPSVEDLSLHRAEQAVVRFWRVVDRLSADPESDLTKLTTVSRGSVAAQWARNINQYRFDQVKAEGRVVVRDVMAKQSKDDYLYKVTACIDSSRVTWWTKTGNRPCPQKDLAESPMTTPRWSPPFPMPWHNLRAGKQHTHSWKI